MHGRKLCALSWTRFWVIIGAKGFSRARGPLAGRPGLLFIVETSLFQTRLRLGQWAAKTEKKSASRNIPYLPSQSHHTGVSGQNKCEHKKIRRTMVDRLLGSKKPTTKYQPARDIPSLLGKTHHTGLDPRTGLVFGSSQVSRTSKILRTTTGQLLGTENKIPKRCSYKP